LPYIIKHNRYRYYSALVDLEQGLTESGWEAGHLVYIFYRLLVRFWKFDPRFATINTIRGILMSTLAEFDRRVAAGYEDKKMEENGDV
jgi:hypothetical protein